MLHSAIMQKDNQLNLGFGKKNAQPIIFNYNFSKYIKLAKIASIYVFGFVEDA